MTIMKIFMLIKDCRRQLFTKMQFTVCLLLSVITAQGAGVHKSYLIDSQTGDSLVLASILDRNGNLVALTENDGAIPDLLPTSFPITFSYMGYESREIATIPTSDVALTPKMYELSEVVIKPGTHPLLYVTAYMREYGTSFGSSDSVTIYNESIVDFMIPVGKTKNKGWRKPRTLAENTYMRHTNSNGLDSVSDKIDDMYLLAAKSHIYPSAKSAVMTLPPNIATTSGQASRTIFTKDSTKIDWLRNGNVIKVNYDVMTRYKNHVYTPNALKLLGATMDITEAMDNYTFVKEDNYNKLSPADVRQISRSMKMIGRGKVWRWSLGTKNPIDMRYYAEIYVLNREYVTEAEAKELKKETPVVSAERIVAPNGTPDLHPGIQSIVNRINSRR